MELKNMTRSGLVIFNSKAQTKAQVLDELVSALDKEGVLSSAKDFMEAVIKREEISATGLERGLAIPHGKSASVKQAMFAVARLEQPISDWESIDPSNQVQLVFLLAIPEAEAGSTHLKVLSELSTRLMDEKYMDRLMAANSPEAFLEALDQTDEAAPETEQQFTKTVVAITACAAGIAHTYMAAEALEKAGRELGVRVLVEKQGANGLEDEHSRQAIQEADAVIFATDIAPKGKERFAGKPYVQTRVAEPLKRGKEMIHKALENPDGVIDGQVDSSAAAQTPESNGFFKDMVQAVMTGISYMIPVIVAAGIMVGLAKLGAMPFGLVNEISDPKYANHANDFYVILHYLDQYGAMIFKFMYPVFAAFVAYSLADRTGLVAGFIGGAFAGGLHFTFWNNPDGVPSGFFGALILGLAAGYIARFLNKK